MAHQVEVRLLFQQILEEVGHRAGHGTRGGDHRHAVPVEATTDVEEQVACKPKKVFLNGGVVEGRKERSRAKGY